MCVSSMPSSIEELASSVRGARTRWENGQAMDAGACITLESRVRILRAGCARLVNFLSHIRAQSPEAELKNCVLLSVSSGYAVTEKLFISTTRQTTPEFTTKRSSRVLKFQQRYSC